jgi:hypothetical protein
MTSLHTPKTSKANSTGTAIVLKDLEWCNTRGALCRGRGHALPMRMEEIQ